MSLSAYLCEEVYESEEEYEESYTVSKKQVTYRSICCVFGGRCRYGNKECMWCLEIRFKISTSRCELPKTKCPDGISYPFGKNAMPHAPQRSLSEPVKVKHVTSSCRKA